MTAIGLSVDVLNVHCCCQQYHVVHVVDLLTHHMKY